MKALNEEGILRGHIEMPLMPIRQLLTTGAALMVVYVVLLSKERGERERGAS